MLFNPPISGKTAITSTKPIAVQNMLGSSSNSSSAESLQWILPLNGQPASMMLADPRLKDNLRSLLPHAHLSWDRHPLFEVVPALIRVDTTPIKIQDDRYVTVSGSSPALWTSRSILWFDLNEKKPLCIFVYIQNITTDSKNTDSSVHLDVYTTLNASEPLPGALLAEIAAYIRSLGSNVTTQGNIHFAGGSDRPLRW